MATVKYRYRKGHGGRVPAEVAGAELDRIRQQNGELRPDQVVAAARDRRSPLHHHFTWDPSKAAQKCRLIEARNLIRAIEVYAVHIDGRQSPPVIAFVHIGGQEQGYQSSEVVQSDDAMYAAALADAKRQLRGMRQRYGYITELVKLWQAIDRLLAE